MHTQSTLRCPACAAPLAPEDLDARQRLAACRHCGGLFDIARVQAAAGSVFDSGSVPAVRGRVPMPEYLKVQRRGNAVEVSWRWMSPLYIFLAFFAVAWNAFLVVWYTLVLGQIPEGGVMMAPFVLFPLVHVAAGIGIAYLAVAGFLNSTHLRAEKHGRVQVSHGPLPWYPNPHLPADDLTQLYVVRHERQNKNGASITYKLFALDKDHRRIPLLAGLDDRDQALWLEQEVEAVLGLRDEPVEGSITS
jgi:hypothetical protein